MSAKRQWVLAGARVTTGMLGIAAAVATVGAAALLPWPSYVAEPLATVVSPASTEQQRVCPGPLLTLGADTSNLSAASSIGAPDVVFAAGDGRGQTSGLSLSPAPVQVAKLGVPDNTSGSSDGTPLMLSVPASDDGPVLLGGSQSQQASSETLTGFAAASCAEAITDTWLVAGSTMTGQTSLLLLSNPTTVAATVDLRIFGESGLVDAPGSTGILVQPGTQRILPLAGLAPNLNSPVVHVSTRGGQVVASVQQSVIRGLTPGGIELVGATTGPSNNQIIGGFVIPAAIHDETQSNDTDFHDDQAAVRVLNTSDVSASLSVSVTSDEGGNGTSLSVMLEPGVASEIPMSTLNAGSYTVRLNSDQPIVAAARSTEKSAESEDFAWFVASQSITDATAIVVAEGPSPVLRLVNASSAPQTLTLTPEKGAALTLDLPAMSSLSQPVLPGQSYSLHGENVNNLIATVSYQGNAVLSSFAVNPPGPLARPIAVYTH